MAKDFKYDVSVIIPMYNASKLVERCLSSILRQKGEYAFEIIIIDDGSTDNSCELVRNHKAFEHIKLLRQKNCGPALARNRGIELASGKYITFIDADDYWLEDFFNTTIGYLNVESDCIAASVAQRHLTVSGCHEWPMNWDSISGGMPKKLNDFFLFWGEYNHICTGSIMIRAEVAKKAGGQRPELRICEDLEYWAYLSTFGKMAYIPKLLFVSDGSKVTADIGWVEKNLPRWKNAVAVDVWEIRLLPRIQDDQLSDYKKARGIIAQNLSYSIMMSKRYDLARKQIKVYGRDFPNSKMSCILRFAASNSLFWYIISRLLVYREYHRR